MMGTGHATRHGLILSSRRVVERRIFRSARPGKSSIGSVNRAVLISPDDATISDRSRLSEEYGISTIMDLRTLQVRFNPVNPSS
jgi:hypothetical protein